MSLIIRMIDKSFRWINFNPSSWVGFKLFLADFDASLTLTILDDFLVPLLLFGHNLRLIFISIHGSAFNILLVNGFALHLVS